MARLSYLGLKDCYFETYLMTTPSYERENQLSHFTPDEYKPPMTICCSFTPPQSLINKWFVARTNGIQPSRDPGESGRMRWVFPASSTDKRKFLGRWDGSGLGTNIYLLVKE